VVTIEQLLEVRARVNAILLTVPNLTPRGFWVSVAAYDQDVVAVDAEDRVYTLCFLVGCSVQPPPQMEDLGDSFELHRRCYVAPKIVMLTSDVVLERMIATLVRDQVKCIKDLMSKNQFRLVKRGEPDNG
jgi:hypothetical protein